MTKSITISFPDWVEYDESNHSAEIDTHKAYPYWFRLFAEHRGAPADLESNPDPYWTECAFQCCKLEVFRVCGLVYGRMPRFLRFRDKADEDGNKQYKYADLEPDAEKRREQVRQASKGLHARQHYVAIRGEENAKAAGLLKF